MKRHVIDREKIVKIDVLNCDEQSKSLQRFDNLRVLKNKIDVSVVLDIEYVDIFARHFD